MSKRLRTITTPATVTDLSEGDEPLTYWKQILPEGQITTPDGRRIVFDRAYHDDLIDSYKRGVTGNIGFQLATPLNGHGHDMDPERQRAEIKDVARYDQLPDDVRAEIGDKPGLYGKVQFFSKKAARAVRNMPALGVSARIKENILDSDGRRVKAAIVHVLGTMNPVVTGMDPWRAVNLSDETMGEQIDLSDSHYEGVTMAKGKGGTDTLEAEMTPAQLAAKTIAELSEEDFAEFMSEYGNLTTDDSGGGTEDDEDEDLDDDATDDSADGAEPTEANLSATQQRAIDLARTEAREAHSQARAARQELAVARWERERASYLANGVPVADLDLCAPLLARPEEMVVDLSHEDGPGAEVNVGEIIRALLDSREGTIDMSRETGHGGNGDDDEDEDEAMFAALDRENR